MTTLQTNSSSKKEHTNHTIPEIVKAIKFHVSTRGQGFAGFTYSPTMTINYNLHCTTEKEKTLAAHKIFSLPRYRLLVLYRFCPQTTQGQHTAENHKKWQDAHHWKTCYQIQSLQEKVHNKVINC